MNIHTHTQTGNPKDHEKLKNDQALYGRSEFFFKSKHDDDDDDQYMILLDVEMMISTVEKKWMFEFLIYEFISYIYRFIEISIISEKNVSMLEKK